MGEFVSRDIFISFGTFSNPYSESIKKLFCLSVLLHFLTSLLYTSTSFTPDIIALPFLF